MTECPRLYYERWIVAVNPVEFLVEDGGPWPFLAIMWGHEDAEDFRTAVEAELDVQYDEGQFRPVGDVCYGWARKIPSTDPSYRWMFWPVGQKVRDGRGVFPYTCVDIEEVDDDDD